MARPARRPRHRAPRESRPSSGLPRGRVMVLDRRLLRRARPARLLLAADAAIGVAAALLVLGQAALIAAIAADSFHGASLVEVRTPLTLLVVVVSARAAAAWGFEAAGRTAAARVLSDLRLGLV